MSTITCPNCKTAISIEEALKEEVEKDIQKRFEQKNKQIYDSYADKIKMLEMKEKEFELKKQKENELFSEKLQKELAVQIKLQEDKLEKKYSEAAEAKIKFLEARITESIEKEKLLQSKELETIELKQLLEKQKNEEEYKLRKQRLELEEELKNKIVAEVLEKERVETALMKTEYDKKLKDQQNLLEEMQRKMLQGSMQTQGEVQELALEEWLSRTFPYDTIMEIKKGQRGADCILEIKNELGQVCGKILFESKNAKEFKKEWLLKLKEDLLLAKCDIGILVSRILPDDIKTFDQIDGIWVCKMQDVTSLTKVLRESLINIAKASKSQENKGEKKEMLYNYFTSNEFIQQITAIKEAYLALKSSIDKERLYMEKIWKEREKQIDKVLLNNTHLIGTISGIAGNDIEEIE